MTAPTPTAPTLEELLERISIALSPPHLGWYALLVDCQAAIRRLRDEKRAAGQDDLAALRAENERLRALLPLAAFGMRVIEAHREDCGDLDGGFLQDTAQECALLADVKQSEPCGDACRCAEYYGADEWPVDCLRYSPAARAAFVALADPAPDAERAEGGVL